MWRTESSLSRRDRGVGGDNPPTNNDLLQVWRGATGGGGTPEGTQDIRDNMDGKPPTSSCLQIMARMGTHAHPRAPMTTDPGTDLWPSRWRNRNWSPSAHDTQALESYQRLWGRGQREQTMGFYFLAGRKPLAPPRLWVIGLRSYICDSVLHKITENIKCSLCDSQPDRLYLCNIFNLSQVCRYCDGLWMRPHSTAYSIATGRPRARVCHNLPRLYCCTRSLHIPQVAFSAHLCT